MTIKINKYNCSETNIDHYLCRNKIVSSLLKAFRFKFLNLLGSGFILFANNARADQKFQTKKSKPNMLFIAVDDLKPTLGCYGDTKAITPNIDRLSANGVTFLNNYCQQAVCGPSRTSLLTGMYPDSTRIWDLRTKFRAINPNIVTIPQYFSKNGYESIGMGKIFDNRNTDKGRDTLSWDRRVTGFQYLTPQAKRYGHAYQANEHLRQVDELEKKLGRKITPSERWKIFKKHGLLKAVDMGDVPDNSYLDGALTESAVSEIKKLAKSSKPFFLAVGFSKPHLPFSAPKKYWDMYKRDEFKVHPFQKHAKDSPIYAYHNSGELRSYSDIPNNRENTVANDISDDQQKELIHGYYACVSYIDALIGKLTLELKKSGLDKNTIIVLWGDHGWHLGDHGQWCKHSNLEQAVRSPMIISAPDMKKNLKTEDPTGFIDIFPTLCDLAGLAIPKQCQGVSLTSILEGKKAVQNKYVISQYPRLGNKFSDDKKVKWWEYMGYSLRTKRFRYTLWTKNWFYTAKTFNEKDIAFEELYDLKNDPLETANIAKNKNVANTRKILYDYMTQYFARQRTYIEKYLADNNKNELSGLTETTK